jgi:hypothetical protein
MAIHHITKIILSNWFNYCYLSQLNEIDCINQTLNPWVQGSNPWRPTNNIKALQIYICKAFFVFSEMQSVCNRIYSIASIFSWCTITAMLGWILGIKKSVLTDPRSSICGALTNQWPTDRFFCCCSGNYPQTNETFVRRYIQPTVTDSRASCITRCNSFRFLWWHSQCPLIFKLSI